MKPIGILQMAGISGPFKRTINVPGGEAPQNLRTLANAAGYTGTRDVELIFNVVNGTTLNGGIVGGAWPEAQLRNIVLNVAGSVHGYNGVGGSNAIPNPGDGGVGGDAIYCTIPMDINILPTGQIKGGGGGGGAGGGWSDVIGPPGEEEPISGLGGAGGTGFPHQQAGGDNVDFAAGDGGSGGATATAGAPGAAATRGTGTVYPGGMGGGAGWAIRKNGQTVPVVNNGIIVGTQA